jgi:succinate dehydrogenase/fumarate reductase iron-sulfur protein
MARNQQMVPVRVFRFDPKTDKKPRHETYHVPIAGKTVLDTLQFIYENHDSSLSFRSGCAGGGYQRCGACPVMVNGKPVLACAALIEPEMTIDPHPKFEIIKDLVLDFAKANKRTKEIKPTVQIEVDREKCDGCRDCVLLCPLKVFDLRKIRGKTVSIPSDQESCCGTTCRQCVVFCRNQAISLIPVQSRAR